MTYQSIWRRVCMGAKLGLGAAVVAGVMAFSGTAQAATITTTGGLQFDPAMNILAMGSNYGLNAVCDASSCGPGDLLAKFTAVEDVPVLTISTILTPADFTNAKIVWQDTGGNEITPPLSTSGSVSFSMSAGDERWLSVTWDAITKQSSFLNVRVEAIPLPAGLVLFLSGLVGIGFLGRYKAKRRREEPAAA